MHYTLSFVEPFENALHIHRVKSDAPYPQELYNQLRINSELVRLLQQPRTYLPVIDHQETDYGEAILIHLLTPLKALANALQIATINSLEREGALRRWLDEKRRSITNK